MKLAANSSLSEIKTPHIIYCRQRAQTHHVERPALLLSLPLIHTVHSCQSSILPRMRAHRQRISLRCVALRRERYKASVRVCVARMKKL